MLAMPPLDNLLLDAGMHSVGSEGACDSAVHHSFWSQQRPKKAFTCDQVASRHPCVQCLQLLASWLPLACLSQ